MSFFHHTLPPLDPNGLSLMIPSIDSHYLLEYATEESSALLRRAIEESSDPLSVLPTQAYSVNVEWSPEQRLQWEVLSDSWEILWGNICGVPTQEKKRKELRITQEWFDTRDADWPFALDGICSSLGINADQLRKVMRARPCPRIVRAGMPLSATGKKNTYRPRTTHSDVRQEHHRWRGEDDINDTYLLPARQAA